MLRQHRLGLPLLSFVLCGLVNPGFIACAAAAPQRRLRESVDPNTAQLAADINAFGDALFDQVALKTPAGKGAGLILSPFSVAQALAMLLNGAEPEGESAQQILAALGPVGINLTDFNSLLSDLTSEVVKEPAVGLVQAGDAEPGPRVDNANSAWLKQGLSWQPQFTDALSSYYNASLESLTSAEAVNAWVSEATNGKITQIASEDVVKEAVLILVNAVYFKAGWVHSFNNFSTEAAPFDLLDGGSQESAMMMQPLEPRLVQVASLPADLGDAAVECAAIKLPYEGFTYSGVVAMPVGNWSEELVNGQRALDSESGPVPYADALAACRKAVSASLVPAEVAGDEEASVWGAADYPINLYLPRFEIEFSSSLNAALQALNISQPFVGGDLTQMAEGPDGAPLADLAVSEVLHKVYEKVDEKGTEAAAVTMIAVATSAPDGPIKPPVDLRFDRPFVFDIVHGASGLALFSGEIYKPEAWEAAA